MSSRAIAAATRPYLLRRRAAIHRSQFCISRRFSLGRYRGQVGVRSRGRHVHHHVLLFALPSLEETQPALATITCGILGLLAVAFEWFEGLRDRAETVLAPPVEIQNRAHHAIRGPTA